MSQIDNLKRYLSQLVKYHIYMEAGTPTEAQVLTQLDNTVNQLLEWGVSEMEIRSIIERAQVYDVQVLC